MSPKKNASARPKRMPAGEVTPVRPIRETDSGMSTFQPRHGPNVADRADTVDDHPVTPAPRQPDVGDEGQEAEKAGRNG